MSKHPAARKSSRSPSRFLACAMPLAFVIAMTGDAFCQSAVQGVPNAMQGFSQNRNQPSRLRRLHWKAGRKKEATFSGNVKVVQGDTTMTSKMSGRLSINPVRKRYRQLPSGQRVLPHRRPCCNRRPRGPAEVLLSSDWRLAARSS